MEITAAWRAVQAIEGPLEVVSDSTYVVNCFRQEWWRGWIERGWTNSRKQPVANRDLWEPLIEAFVAGRFGVPRWVKGHSGDVMNDRVDALAVRACQTGAGESGP
jgi:ribonuclease HI